MILHGRRRRQVALLAAGALPGDERAAAEAHARACPECGARLAALQRLSGVLAADRVASADLPVSFEALEARVRARLREAEARSAAPARRVPRLLAPAAAAAALLALGAVLLQGRAQPPRPATTREVAASAAAAVAPAAREELLRRMERSLAREQAARYLSEAQDVLVTVASGPPPCRRTRQTIEVEDEARRSRDLLARRALLVELGRDEAASAQQVMVEVEEMLREVAALPSCVRPGQLRALERQIEDRRLLMKIDLMQRELVG